MNHPFKRGQEVECIKAPEQGIPINEGQKYIVEQTFFGNQQYHEATIPGMEKTPGICVEGVDGYFTADRFR